MLFEKKISCGHFINQTDSFKPCKWIKQKILNLPDDQKTH